MIKRIFFLLILFIVLSLNCFAVVNINNTNLHCTTCGYSVFVNSSQMDSLKVTSSNINIYNIRVNSLMKNINLTDAIINFHNMSYNIAIQNTSDGSIVYESVKQNDEYNLTLNPQQEIRIILDNTFPAIYFVPPTETLLYINRNYIMINTTAYDLNYKNMTIRLYKSSTQIDSLYSNQSNAFLNSTSLTEDIYYFNATAYDTVGKSNYTETRNVTIDLTNPIISFNNDTDSSGTYYRQYIQANVTANDTYFNNVTIYVYDYAGNILNQNSTSSGNLFVNYTLIDGTYYMNASATDLAGNINWTDTRTIIITHNLTITNVIYPNVTNRQYILSIVAVVYDDIYNVSYVQAKITMPNSTVIYQNLTKTLQFLTITNWELQYVPMQLGYYYFNITAYDLMKNYSYPSQIKIKSVESTNTGGSGNLITGGAIIPQNVTQVYTINFSSDRRYYKYGDDLNITINTFINGNKTDFFVVGIRITQNGTLVDEYPADKIANGTYFKQFKIANGTYFKQFKIANGTYFKQFKIFGQTGEYNLTALGFLKGELVTKSMIIEITPQADLKNAIDETAHQINYWKLTLCIIGIFIVLCLLFWLLFVILKKKKKKENDV